MKVQQQSFDSTPFALMLEQSVSQRDFKGLWGAWTRGAPVITNRAGVCDILSIPKCKA